MYEYEKYSIIIDFFCVIDPPFLFIVVALSCEKYNDCLVFLSIHHRHFKSFKGPPNQFHYFSNFSKRERERERE